MYKLLLSWRYLRTRYIALASIISVTLGVATLIVVNSVMSGFAEEMHKRLHGILSDIVVESHDLDGMPDARWHMEEIRNVVGSDLAGMTAVVHVPAMLNFRYRGQWVTRQINLIGIDETTYANVSDFSQYLLHPANRQTLSFLLREEGYAAERQGFPESGWVYRRQLAAYERAYQEQLRIEQQRNQTANGTAESARAAGEAAAGIERQGISAAPVAAGDSPSDPYAALPTDPFATPGPAAENVYDPARDQSTGVVLGIAICSVRQREADGQVQDYYLCRPGDDVEITFPNTGQPPRAVTATFTVVDLYESKMSEYDSSFAFVPLERLQHLRSMIDPQSGLASVSSIQLRLRPGVDLNAVRDKLRRYFPADQFPYRIQTWRDMQGPLLAAVRLETTILNILLFLIIAVAGFGILATFFMIVVEKTKDIGILKSLGAPSSGVMSIFLGYGFSLGLAGSGAGMVLGLLFVHYINEIADLLERLTGQEVFDQTVYYFQEIPAITEPFTVAWVVFGAVLIAVLASVLPALRAARLHPVEALRYE